MLCAIFEQRYFFLGVKMLSLSASIRANLLRGFLNILNLYQHDDTMCVCVCVCVLTVSEHSIVSLLIHGS